MILWTTNLCSSFLLWYSRIVREPKVLSLQNEGKPLLFSWYSLMEFLEMKMELNWNFWNWNCQNWIGTGMGIAIVVTFLGVFFQNTKAMTFFRVSFMKIRIWRPFLGIFFYRRSNFETSVNSFCYRAKLEFNGILWFFFELELGGTHFRQSFPPRSPSKYSFLKWSSPSSYGKRNSSIDNESELSLGSLIKSAWASPSNF